MPILLTALALGTISMIIVFISGMTSGVVRWGTLALRILFAFCMTSAASYFLMMLFDLYDEMKLKKLKAAAEALEAETVAQTEEMEAAPPEESESPPPEKNPVPPPPPAPNFQPMDASNLPNIGR